MILHKKDIQSDLTLSPLVELPKIAWWKQPIYIYSIPNFYIYVCIFNWIFLFLWISYRIYNDFAQKRHPIRSDLGFVRWTSKNCMVKAVFIYCYPTSRGATAHTPKLGFFAKKKTRTFAKSGNVLRPRAYVIKQIFKKYT